MNDDSRGQPRVREGRTVCTGWKQSLGRRVQCRRWGRSMQREKGSSGEGIGQGEEPLGDVD